MFKKIEIWILYLVVLFGLLFAIAFGFLVRQELVGSTKLGFVSKIALALSEIPVKTRKVLLNSDTQVDDRFTSVEKFKGTPNSQTSYLLLSRFTEKEGIVELIDLKNFKVLHTWNPDVDKFNSLVTKVNSMTYLNKDANNIRGGLYHPMLTNDGGLIHNSQVFRKIDSCSNLVYQNSDQHYHHSIEVDIDGYIWVPIHKYPSNLPVKKVGKNHLYDDGFVDDAIVKLSHNGDVLFQKSVSEIFIENGMEHRLFSLGQHFSNDPIHLNDIQPVNFDSRFWKKGDVFLSLRHQSMVILYRPSSGKIIWKGEGPFHYQHDIDILNEHSISIFNNNSKNFVNGTYVDGNNEILIYNFLTDEYTTHLSNSLIAHDVRTITAGLGQILPNGDLFVEEQNYGRLVYFNNHGTLRWSYVNRSKDGKVRYLNWSRILYNQQDISLVKNFLDGRLNCEK